MNRTTDLIYTLRQDYDRQSLDEKTVKKSPFEQFEVWMAEAIAEEVDEPNAMILSTAAPDGSPSSRVVLLRGFDRKGFVFYTNYESQKGREIAGNPQAALLFFWPRLERQIRIQGVISQTSRLRSEEYFATRPRESQLGAWASAQSSVIGSRRELEERFAELERRFAGKDIPCPEFWGGYLLEPKMFEFWQGGKNRLHDRLRYTKPAKAWRIERLSP